MTSLLALATLIAADAPVPPAPGQRPASITDLLPLIITIIAAAYFLFYLPSRRERKRQAAMFAGIKKNDKVQTASGIYGVVTDVSKETNKVTLRIDESTGAKVRMDLTSVLRVLGDEPSSDASSK